MTGGVRGTHVRKAKKRQRVKEKRYTANTPAQRVAQQMMSPDL